ncbi:tripartite tricarboxylate transporter TctB family protein [Chloroflexota bacterium]
MENTKDRTELFFYITTAAVSLGLIIYAWSQPWAHKRAGDGLLISAFPIIFAAIILLVSIIGVLAFVINSHKGIQKQPMKEEFYFWPVLLLTASVFAGAIGIWRFDGVITCSVVVLYVLLIGGVRDWRLLSGLPLGMGVMIYILFVRIVGVYFPHGWLR